MKVRRHEAGPFPVLPQLDRHEPALEGPVDRVKEEDAVGFKDPGYFRDDSIKVSHMLENVAAVDDVKGCFFKGNSLADSGQVEDVEVLLLAMFSGGFQRWQRRVGSCDKTSQRRELLGQQSAAAPYVESGLAARVKMKSCR